MLFLYLIYVLACNSLSLYTYLLAGSCYGLTNCHLIWPCLGLCIGYDSEMPSNSVSEHFVSKFSQVDIASYPQTPSISMLPMLIVLCTITYINGHLSSIQAALQLVGLTTKELLPTALYNNFWWSFVSSNCEFLLGNQLLKYMFMCSLTYVATRLCSRLPHYINVVKF